MMDLSELIEDLAHAFKEVDSSGPVGASRTRKYKPGLGPLNEREAILAATEVMRRAKPDCYNSAAPMRYPGASQTCDLVIPGQWALEFKLLRPFGDNGIEAEHWSENILHPYPGNVSSIGDCLKLTTSAFKERKGIVIFSFEHSPPKLEIEIAIKSFEMIAKEILLIPLGPRISCAFLNLIHPYHQQGKVFGWEILQP